MLIDKHLPRCIKQDYLIANEMIIANEYFHREHKKGHADSNIQIFIRYDCYGKSSSQNMRSITRFQVTIEKEFR